MTTIGISTETIEDGVGLRCKECRSPLPLKLSCTGQEAILWECAKCGLELIGVASKVLSPSDCSRIRIAAMNFEVSKVEEESLTQSCKGLSSAPLQEGFRASTSPSLISREEVHSRILPIKQDYSGAGPAVLSLVEHLSEGQLTCLTVERLKTSLVAIELYPANLRSIQVFGEVQRCPDSYRELVRSYISLRMRLG